MRNKFIFIFLVCNSTLSLLAQEVINLPEILTSLEEKFTIQFNYVVDDIRPYELISPSQNLNLDECLNYLQEETGLVFKKVSQVIISIKKPVIIKDKSSRNIALDTILLTSYLVRGIDKSARGNYQIDFSKFSLLPGLIEADVLQSIQSLPGIQSVDETVSNISIRGGSNDQNLVLWDDIKMYQSGHFFGLISVFNPQITKKVTVSKNGTDVSYTEGVSGIIAMHTDEKVASQSKGSIGFNFLSADGFLDAKLGENSSLQIAARRSLNDFIETPTYDKYFDRVASETQILRPDTNTRNTDQRFAFYDTSLRWLYKIDDKNTLRVNFITISNDLSFEESVISDQETPSRTSSIAQNSIAAGIQYEHTWNQDQKTQLHIYESDYQLKAINVNIVDNQQFLQENTVSETSVKIIHKTSLNAAFAMKAGYHIVETGVKNLNEVDVPLFRDRKVEVIRDHGVFLGFNYGDLERPLSISGGLRYNYIEKFKKSLFEPRLSARYAINKRVTLEAQGELKHQNISQVINFQNDFLGVEKRRWQLANEIDIPIIKSKQVSVGAQYDYQGWLLDITGFIKKVDGITAQSQGFETKYEFDKAIGSYSVNGVDVLLRNSYRSLTSWISYAFMKNDYIFSEIEEVNFSSNFDITHSATLGLTYDKNNLKISTGLNYRVGKPTTRPELGNEVVNNIINYDTVNSERLEDYVRVDISAVYPILKRDLMRIDFGISILNILDKENTFSNFYRLDTNSNAQEFEKRALGFTTNAVIRVHFF